MIKRGDELSKAELDEQECTQKIGILPGRTEKWRIKRIDELNDNELDEFYCNAILFRKTPLKAQNDYIFKKFGGDIAHLASPWLRLCVEPAVAISASRLEVGTSFSGHPSSGYGSYRLRRALYTLKYAMKWYTSTD